MILKSAYKHALSLSNVGSLLLPLLWGDWGIRPRNNPNIFSSWAQFRELAECSRKISVLVIDTVDSW